MLRAVFIIAYNAAVLRFESEIEDGEYDFLRVLISGIIGCIVGATLLGSLEVLLQNRILRIFMFVGTRDVVNI